MNPENYKSIRNKPKRNSAISRSKSRMLAKPIVAPATQKLRDNYQTRIEWATKVLPKLKE
jgi:hypothetical protein